MKYLLLLITIILTVHTGKSQTVISGMPSTIGEVTSLIRIGNTIYIGGGFTQVNGNPRQHLARFDANTGVLDSWSPTVNNDVTMLKNIGNKLIVGGSFYLVNSQSHYGICMFDLPSGNLNNWTDTADFTSYNQGIGVRNNTFYFHNFDFNTNSGKIKCVDASTGTTLPWQSDSIIGGNVKCIQVWGNYVYVGGLFNITNFNSIYKNLCRFNVNSGALDTSFHPAPNGTNYGIMSMAQINSKMFIGGVYDTIAGVRRTGLASFDSNGNITNDNIVFSTEQIFSICGDGDKLWVGGIYSSAAGYYRRRMSQINTTNMLPTCWDGISVTNNWLSPNYIFVSGDTVYASDASSGPISAFINSPVPHPSNISGLSQVTPLQSVGYSVSPISGCTFNWLITGGSGSSTTNSITVNWGSGPLGKVSLVVTNSAGTNCYSDTIIVNVSIGNVGLEEKANSYFNLFPNPANDKVLVTTINCKNSEYKLSDITGKNVLINLIKSDNFEIDLNTIPSGIYVLSINNENEILRKKIIKQ